LLGPGRLAVVADPVEDLAEDAHGMSFEKKSGHPEVGPMPGLSDKSAIEAKRGGKKSRERPRRTQKKPRAAGLFFALLRGNYLSFVSLYSTCLRALGSNFMIDIFSGIVFLFLLVV
jgi:hypothetical protein